MKIKYTSTNRIAQVLTSLLLWASFLALHNNVVAGVSEGEVNARFEVRNLIPFVDERIGINVGKCSLGVSLPFGSIRPCPHTPTARRTGYSSAGKLAGFTVVNTGMVNKYVNLLVSPQTGLDCWDDRGKPTGHDSEKADEIIRPDYYSVELTRFGIRAEVTATEHAAIFRLTYPETTNDRASLVIYPSHTLWAGATFSTVDYDPAANEITGYFVVNDGWYFAKGMKIYYAIRFSKPVRSFGTFDNVKHKLHEGSNSIAGNGVGCYLKFDTGRSETVYAKVSISTKNSANAQAFLDAEIPGWDFSAVQAHAAEVWNRALSSILIDDPNATKEEKTIFYTALYHTLISPKNRTGDCPWNYSGPYYDDQFCVWDTFRTEFPLLTLIQQHVVRDTVRSYIAIYKHYGYAPDAFLCGRGDMVQGGDDVDMLVADAYMKGVPGIDWADAYELLKGDATISGRTPAYRERDRGWVPYGSITKMAYATASKTMEFAYNDFCASEVAAGLGHQADAKRFQTRSCQWTNLWDKDSSSDGFHGFIQAKDINGDWQREDPAKNPRGSFSLFFYEGDSWTYSFDAPHQVARLIQMMGGKKTFVARLKHYVSQKLEIGNEPCFLTSYLFNYAGRPDLTSRFVRQIDSHFTGSGYPGDDDSGAMSSWYIFSQLGFFPVAGQDLYLVNGPRYRTIIVQMENGKKIIIHAKNTSAKNKYIQSATLNGSPLKRAWFKHDDLKNGAQLDFDMGSADSVWGQNEPPPPSY